MWNISVQTQTFHQQILCISLYLHLLTQLHVNAGLVLQTAINTQHTRAMYGWILIFLIEIISLYLPKASFVAFLPFKSSYSWAQFAFERCQDNALLKYCTETVHKISHVQQISILLRVFFFQNYSSLLSQPHPQELSGYATKINRMLQVMSPRDLPSRETEGKGRKQNKILFLSFLWIINEPGCKIKHQADELDLKKTLLIGQMHQNGLFLNARTLKTVENGKTRI